MDKLLKWDNYKAFDTEFQAIAKTVTESTFIDSTRYSGFDPSEIQKALEKSRRDKGISEQVHIINIVKMIFLFLIRGTSIDRMITKTSEQGKTMIRDLKREYSLVSSLTGTNAGSNKVNLSRVAASFPAITVSLLHSNEEVLENRPMPYAAMQNICKDYPKVFMSSICASVISDNKSYLTSEQSRIVINALSLYGGYETHYINKNFKNDLKGALKDSRKYIMASFMSKILSDTQKIEICKSDLMSDVFSSFDVNDVILTEAVKSASAIYISLTE